MNPPYLYSLICRLITACQSCSRFGRAPGVLMVSTYPHARAANMELVTKLTPLLAFLVLLVAGSVESTH